MQLAGLDDSGSSSNGGSTSSTATYGGTYTIGGKSYDTLTMSGTSESGTTKFSGSEGTLSGTYSQSETGKR